MTIPSGATTVVPGNWRFLPETKNIGLHLTHGLNNSSLEILAIHLADGRHASCSTGMDTNAFTSPVVLSPTILTARTWPKALNA
jgi:hypothetical protein